MFEIFNHTSLYGSKVLFLNSILQLYIILIRPERNVRQSMMPMRYSAINKSSATAGSGSMMAPVMVTAATCDQKQQIQKHVPLIQREVSEKEGRSKSI